MSQSLIQKLDLVDYLNSLQERFARKKDIKIQGDLNIHYTLIKELETYNFKSPQNVDNLNILINHIKKQGVLKFYEIYEFIKIIEYFLYVQNSKLEGKVLEWFEKIKIPQAIRNITSIFDNNGELKEGINEDYDEVIKQIKINNESLRENLYKIINQKKLSPYLVNAQIHLLHGELTLLVRGGFNHVLKGKIIDRSSSGFFYVVPNDSDKLKRKIEELIGLKENIIYKISKEISTLFLTHIKFIEFINKEFDRLDHYLARVEFAKEGDKNFIIPSNKVEQKLINFIHPALKFQNAKAISIDFSKSVIMITGVNAGGKTMLLKSILSAVYLSKYLIPYKANQNSQIGHFKNIEAILDDPQSVKNDISTFAGRMVEFSHLFTKQNTIVGVDEIELGTDSDEAASLFKVIIERLMKRNIKIIITTHHKRLAALLAAYGDVELIAALYDEENRRPTYEFLSGTIGLSYAFETANRYGIPKDVINEAKLVYGEDKDKLNDLITRSSLLELEYQKKLRYLDEKIKNTIALEKNLNDKKDALDSLIYNEKNKLHQEYSEVKEEAKRAIKAKMYQDSHRHLNVAHKEVSKIKTIDSVNEKSFIIGQRVKYNNTKGEIIAINAKKALIETDEGIRLQVAINSLVASNIMKSKVKKKVEIKVEKPSVGNVKLDLHGQRAEEALENLDKFISDCLLNGFDEVLIYHGIGTGKLSYIVKEFLRSHPKIKSYQDAPSHMGGFGAKVVQL